MLTAIGVNAAPTIAPSLVLRFEEIQNVQRWKRDTLAGEERYAVLHIGSGGSSHSWPVEHWTTLARSLAEDRQIVITGTNAEREALTPILTALRTSGTRAHEFMGHALPELAALVAGADAVVSGSTGPGHLAAALGAKTIGLFPLPLALSKERWGFRGRRAVNLSPARLSDCPSCKICNCMERIAVESVFTATRR
jgi:ADP-heptose:LPS heptosyltransferase